MVMKIYKLFIYKALFQQLGKGVSRFPGAPRGHTRGPAAWPGLG